MRAAVSLLSLVLLAGSTVFAAQSPAPAAGAVPDYQHEVRPLLSQFCFKCHGPDEKTRKGDLRLDVREAALSKGKSGERAVVPGKPGESELVKRILSHDPEEVMPPPSAKKEMRADQVEVLKRWVEGGAPYAPHWAFVAPQKAGGYAGNGGAREAIDFFIREKLKAEGLVPAPEADRYTLIRRVSYDLTGLPPTAEEADAFANDPAADAYEKLVDRLLASPQYGERWARKWLDLARYADTNGYEKDRPRTIWPWRDWVIEAINADMPFDRFTIEQLAGDMLPGATPSQIIATGFHRNTMLNEEGGIDPLEFRFHALADRVATTGKTWLGLTTGCAQCHTHKYDPITHREYYQMMAFFNNADEPDFLVRPPDFETRRAEVEAQIAQKTVELRTKFKPQAPEAGPVAGRSGEESEEVRREATVARAFSSWLEQERKVARPWTVLRPQEARANLPVLTVQPDGSVLASGDQTKADVYWLKYPLPAGKITAVRLDVLPDERLPAGGPGRAYYEGPKGDFNLSDLRASVGGVAVKFSGGTHSFAAKNTSAAAAIDDNLQSGWGTNGAQGQAHSAVFRFESPVEGGRLLDLEMHFERHYSADLGRFRIAVTSDSGECIARSVPVEIDALLLKAENALAPEERETLFREFLLRTPELEAQRTQIDRLRKSLTSYPATLVFSERPKEFPRPTHVHHRGEFLQPAEEVQPGVFSFLNPLPPGERGDRLAFARWLVSRENPLTARVTVNRAWAAFFGRGLVRTVDDFGYQGEMPTHPALLDWLAVDFMERGWSMKGLHKELVMSRTYRQSSSRMGVAQKGAERDPQNLLCSRGPRVRLESEMIRDGLLKMAGVLSLKVGGPSVFPPQPEGVMEAAYGKPSWKTSDGESRYRRGLYTYSKRTAPYAMLATFDGPAGDVCVAQREVSDTPLQALTMLNDVVVVEAAQGLGGRVAAMTGSEEERLEWLFKTCLGRPMAQDDLTMLQRFLAEQRRRLETGELDAAALAGKGPGDVKQRALWTSLVRAIFNFDESIMKG
ncbi:MAG: hypothetical protein RLZZ142_735 [Verrucomicrobiota bacterium]